MSEKVRPIADKRRSRATPHKRKQILSHIVRIVALLTAIIGLAFSGWYFMGFAENDGGFKHLASAAFLSFALGGLLYIPSALIALRAHHVVRGRRRPGVLPLILILPWFPISWRMFVLEGIWMSAALCLFGFALLVFIWVLIANRKPQKV